MTLVLHITRTSGLTEVHELPAKGDHVVIPPGLLDTEDVLGFEVEIDCSDRRIPAGTASAFRLSGGGEEGRTPGDLS